LAPTQQPEQLVLPENEARAFTQAQIFDLPRREQLPLDERSREAIAIIRGLKISRLNFGNRLRELVSLNQLAPLDARQELLPRQRIHYDQRSKQRMNFRRHSF
jgi:hypothetical protein